MILVDIQYLLLKNVNKIFTSKSFPYLTDEFKETRNCIQEALSLQATKLT